MLAGLLDKQDKNISRSVAGPAAKRQRVDEGSDLFQTLAQTLHEMRLSVLARDPSLQNIVKLEVEMRVGMLVDGNRRWKSHQSSGGALVSNERGISFKSGIDEIIADKLKGILTGKEYVETVLQPERLRFNEGGDIRRVVDEAGNTIGRAEAKDKFLRRDFACLGHNYDLRLDVASEIAVDSTKVAAEHTTWHTQRLKRRVRYTHPSRSWQVDVTVVETTLLVGGSSKRAPTTSIELEYELIPAALKAWLSCNDSTDCNKLTSKIATELFEVFNLCIPSGASEGSHTGIQSAVTPSSDILSAMSSITSRIRAANNVFNDRPAIGFDGLDFMGCMPLNISRRNLKTLQQNKYFVTEKSDGVRYLLFVLPISAVPSLAAVTGNRSGSPGDVPSPAVAVLMDRSPKLYLPVDAAEIGRALGIGTVLDGEIVFNLSFKKSVFLVFDVLAVDGSPCSQWNFEQRLESLRGTVSQRIASLTSSQGKLNHQQQQSPITPLRLVEKKFVPKSDLQRLLGMMHMDNGHRVYVDPQHNWRHHKSDGLIFQPNLPYLFSTDINLIKWKWPELTSIDLNAILVNDASGPSVGLLAGGADGTMVDCTMRGKSRVAMAPFDTLRLRADIEDSVNPATIAEVSYCPAFGLWTYFHLRGDKTTPNYINTALSILMEQAESISIEELEYRLLARNEAEDDFSAQHSMMLGKVLQRQRKRCESGITISNPDIIVAPATPAPVAVAVAAQTSKCKWSKHRSRQYDRDYWLNEETGERVWEEPADYRGTVTTDCNGCVAPVTTHIQKQQQLVNYDEVINQERAMVAYNAPSCPREVHSVDIPALVEKLRREHAGVITDNAKVGEHRVVFSLPNEDTSHITRAFQEDQILKVRLKLKKQGKVIDLRSFWEVWEQEPAFRQKIIASKDPHEEKWKWAREFHYKIATTFMPGYAKAIFDYFKAAVVLDPCAGWGDRMLGAEASAYVKRYIGFDPNTTLRPGYADTMKACGHRIDAMTDRYVRFSNQFEIHSYPFEVGVLRIPTESIDFVFTSPPFFDYEMYNPKNPQYVDWITEFYDPFVIHACRVVKPGHFVGIYIGDTSAGNIEEFIRERVHRICPMELVYSLGFVGVMSDKVRGVWIFKKAAGGYNPASEFPMYAAAIAAAAGASSSS